MKTIQEIYDAEMVHLYADLQDIDSSLLGKYQDDFDNAKNELKKIQAVCDAYMKYDNDSLDSSIIAMGVAYGVLKSFEELL